MSIHLKDYSYTYPADLIALYPTQKRDESRLMILNRKAQSWKHKNFSNIVDYFQAGDVLVLNNSKVFPCRLETKRQTGGRQEILLLHKMPEDELEPSQLFHEESLDSARFHNRELWKVMINNTRKVKLGAVFEFENLRITIMSENSNKRLAWLEFNGSLLETLEKEAQIPLPPYIQRKNETLDKERYQTVFAQNTGSVAAPTAGLHFTQNILNQLKEKGVLITYVTLHVGLGTFLPVRSDDITQHQMHSEFYTITQDSCDLIQQAKSQNKKITAVGTTSVRVLESAAQDSIPLKTQSGETDIFIYPPYEFKIVDQLITNFHQPESTLLMLVSAFAERELILQAYQEAIEKKYRLFSYGDCMLIV